MCRKVSHLSSMVGRRESLCARTEGNNQRVGVLVTCTRCMQHLCHVTVMWLTCDTCLCVSVDEWTVGAAWRTLTTSSSHRCVCVCACVCACTCACVLCACACVLRVCVCVCVCVCVTCACVCVCACACVLRVRVHVCCVRVRVCCVCVCVCVCVACACVCVCVCTWCITDVLDIRFTAWNRHTVTSPSLTCEARVCERVL